MNQPVILDTYAMVLSCPSCSAVISVTRLNGSPKEFACPNCHAGYRVQLEQIRPPAAKFKPLRPSRYVEAGG